MSAVVGSGPLAAAATAALAARAARVSAVVVVGALDEVTDQPPGLGATVPVTHWRSLCFVGPRWSPGRRGCLLCLRVRAANGGYGPTPESRPATAFGGARGRGWPPWLPRVAAELATELATGNGADARVWVLDARTGTVDRQELLPDSTCPVCGDPGGDPLPVFDRPDTRYTKRDPAVLRTREIDGDVVDDYLRRGIGLFKEVADDLDGPLAASSVEQPVRWGRREPAIGRAETYRAARTVAVLEGLERYASLYRGGAPAPVRAAYADLGDDAVDPVTLGLHPPESYGRPGFPFAEYSPETVVDWLPGHSFARNGPVLVPERAVHWGPRHDGETTFAFETSNGCALGSSVEEAALHGLRELAERDSFLLTWYRRLRLPEVDLGDAPGLRPLLRKAELMTGCRFRAYLSTMEHGMPSFVLLAECPPGEGPSVVAGSGAHPDPEQALAGGLAELVGAVQYVSFHYAERRERALAMLADPDLVTGMTDHAALNCLPEARDRFGFLLDGAADPMPLAAVPATLRADSTDIRADFRTAVAGVLAGGLDVIVVDQTMPELRRHGLHCVKVVVPGLLPMTFGHRNRRTVGLPRLTGVLPYPSGADAEATATRLPHPFP
ncbi:TOMM precursor leader peptide-binding protein [Micromonospora sp. KC207]|uniref:TOMM precursor leader peptide-binding protein n=1 Tax=Micromonospora sp. KC207 TaxID=2530377 RepID=UPI001404AA01|nr:TOMM precursor leader peptide-binding protein [Micromonospora sp. KC207]